jgi:hypothetical protein
MDKRKKFFTAGIILFGLAIIFTVIFIWTFNATITYWTRSNFGGTGYTVVTDIDSVDEEFQIVWAIFAIMSALAATGFSVLGLWTPEDVIQPEN